jgi:hypothetical protein
MDGETTTIRLELRLEEGSLSGSASNGAGPSREFSGWLGLLAAIDALLSSDIALQEDS